jgi:hypothetical protein
MNENPDAFRMRNCYLPRDDEFASVYESSSDEEPKPKVGVFNLGLRRKKNSIAQMFTLKPAEKKTGDDLGLAPNDSI